MEGRPLDDDQGLVRRARDGEVAAYEELVRRHQAVAFRTAWVIAGSTGDAEDAAQEGFVKAYRSLHRFKQGASFRPWLLAIVANEAKNRARSASRRSGLALRVAGSRPSGDAAPSPEEVVLGRVDQAQLASALGRLKPNDRLVIAYRYLFEMSEKEIAAALRCAPGTVKSRLSRALGRLRVELQVHEGVRP